MKNKEALAEVTPLQSYFHRMRGIFWGCAVFMCLFTFFVPVLSESAERYAVTDTTAVQGYEMVAYVPLLATFIITSPVITAMLHNADMSVKKKAGAYLAWTVIQEVAYLACLFLSAVEILNGANHLVRLCSGSYLVLIGNLIFISLGALPVLWDDCWDEVDDEEC